MYSDKKLDQFIDTHKFISAKQLVTEVIESVLQFEGDAERFDDITALCLKYIK